MIRTGIDDNSGLSAQAIDFKTAFESMPGYSILLNLDFPRYTILAATDDFLALTNKERTNIVGKGVFESFPPGDDDPDFTGEVNLVASFKKVVDNKIADTLPIQRYDITDDAGHFSKRYWNASNKPVFDSAGNVVYIIHTTEDITNRVLEKAKDDKIKGLQQAHNLFMQAPMAIHIFKGPDLVIELANEPTLKLWGKEGDIVGKPLVEVLPELKEQGYIDLINKVRETNESFHAYESLVTISKNGNDEHGYYNFILQPYFESDHTDPVGVLVIASEVTERVVIKSTLEAKERSLELAIEIGGLGVYDIDISSKDLQSNPTAYSQQIKDWFELDGKHFSLKDFFNRLHPDDRDLVKETLEASLVSPGHERHELVYRIISAKDGKIKFLRSIGQVRFEGTVPKSISGIIQDVTDQVLAIKKIEESEQRIRSLVESAPFPMGVYTGREMRIEIANQSILDAWGKGNQVVGKLYSDILPELDNQEIFQQLDQVYTTGIPFHAKNQRVDLVVDNLLQPFFFNYSFTPLFDSSGKVYGVMNTAADVTDLNVAKLKIEESEKRFRTMAEATEILVAVSNEKGNVTYLNEAWVNLTGRPMADLKNFGWADLIHPEDRDSFVNYYLQQFAKRESFGGEFRILDKEGNYRWLLSKGPPRFRPDGSFAGYISSSVDITERREAEENLRLTSERFRLLADSMPQFVWTGNSKGRLDYFNKAVYDYSGLSEDVIREGGWLQIVHPDERAENTRQWLQSIATGNDFAFAHRFRRFDGVYRWQLSRATPQRDNAGNIQMWVGTSTDIQDIKELDEQKDYFIAMVSHELKTPITSIKGYVQILQQKYRNNEDEFLKSSLATVNKQVGKTTKLISDLLDVSKIKSGSLSLNKEPFEINHLIEESIDEVKHLNPGYKIEFLKKDDAIVLADKERIGQVMINFLTNAVKYSPQFTEVSVEVTKKTSELIIAVEDFGIGISKSDQQKIFERFYRVEGKNENRFSGFGIGLFIAAEIVRRHNGRIGVNSEPGKGSVFYFTLPV